MWVLAGFAVAVVLRYALLLRRTFQTWGADDHELARAMRGDDYVARPDYRTTLAITVDAPAHCIWPWLVQMGYQRGGLYSYDWLDRLFGYLDRPSADRVLPQFQELSAGDVIPIGHGPGFPVKRVERNRALVLGGEANGFAWTWELGLRSTNGWQTRLISRNRARVPSSIGWKLFMLVLEPAAFVMTRRMLLGIKRRAERLHEIEHLAAARAARRLLRRNCA